MKKICGEITPVQAKVDSECPFNCLECPHFKGLEYHNNEDVIIDCDLED